MLQAATRPEAGSPEPMLFETDTNPDPDRLLDGIGWMGRPDETRVLLIGPNTLELMCALMRRGFAGVVALRTAERSEPSSADIVILNIARVAPIASLGQSVGRAARAVSPGGSMVIAAPADTPALFLRQLERLMLGQGFRAPRTLPVAGRILLWAEHRVARRDAIARAAVATR